MLDEEIEQGETLQIVSKATRTMNYIVDQVCLSVLLVLHTYLPHELFQIERIFVDVKLQMYVIALSVIYSFVFEWIYGKTPGKMFTRTHVIDLDGEKPNIGTLLLRSVCRAIPLELFSFLIMENGFHDLFSKTRVVYDEK